MAKNNPLIEFKNWYAGGAAVVEELTTEAREKMAEYYENLYNAIYVELSTAKGEVNYATAAKQTQILKQVAVEIDKFETKTGSYLMKSLKKISEYGTQVSIRDMELLSDGITKAESFHYDYNRDYAEQAFKDSFEHIAAQTRRIKLSVKEQLRRDAAHIFRRAAVAGISRRQAQRELAAQIKKTMPDFQFIDKRGRAWATKTYLDMLTKTVMANTLNEVYLNGLILEGHDLVKVSRNGATDPCKGWEGRVLSITGATKGYVTIAQAKATGEVFHPRCRHRFVLYQKGLDDVFKAIEEGKSDEEILGFNLDEYIKGL